MPDARLRLAENQTVTRLWRETPPAVAFPAARSLPFDALLAQFEPITLAEMTAVALQDRTDIKFVLGQRQLYHALSALTEQYRVLDVRGVRLNRYRTLYFDTPDFAFFHQHHTGRRERFKVRTRSYVDSRLSFVEVKHKVRGNRTVKNRMPTDRLMTWLTPEAGAFLHNYLPLRPDVLEPKLYNEYTRITLVSKHSCERVTLDLRLHFAGHEEGCPSDQWVELPGLVIAEVKQPGVNRHSDFVLQMRALGLRSARFSKYCIGVALLFDEIKSNRFKPQLRLMKKVILGEHHD